MPPSHPYADQSPPQEPPAVQRAREVRRNLRESLRKLAATLMIVSRGGGNAQAISGEVAAVHQEFERYRETIGGYPSPRELLAMLHLSAVLEEQTPLSSEQLERALSLNAAVRGGLRIAAARLLNLPTEELAGETELLYGVNGMEALRPARNAGRPPR